MEKPKLFLVPSLAATGDLPWVVGSLMRTGIGRWQRPILAGRARRQTTRVPQARDSLTGNGLDAEVSSIVHETGRCTRWRHRSPRLLELRYLLIQTGRASGLLLNVELLRLQSIPQLHRGADVHVVIVDRAALLRI